MKKMMAIVCMTSIVSLLAGCCPQPTKKDMQAKRGLQIRRIGDPALTPCNGRDLQWLPEKEFRSEILLGNRTAMEIAHVESFNTACDVQLQTADFDENCVLKGASPIFSRGDFFDIKNGHLNGWSGKTQQPTVGVDLEAHVEDNYVRWMSGEDQNGHTFYVYLENMQMGDALIKDYLIEVFYKDGGCDAEKPTSTATTARPSMFDGSGQGNTTTGPEHKFIP